MASFGELVLVLGDLHIPSRAREIPAPFKRMLVPGKMQHVICTGNLSSQDYEDLRGLAPNLHVVAGDYDNTNSSGLIFPETRVLQVGGFRIGVVHGHQLLPGAEALARERRKLGVDILVSGHTHQNQVSVSEGCYYHINPVSPREFALAKSLVANYTNGVVNRGRLPVRFRRSTPIVPHRLFYWPFKTPRLCVMSMNW